MNNLITKTKFVSQTGFAPLLSLSVRSVSYVDRMPAPAALVWSVIELRHGLHDKGHHRYKDGYEDAEIDRSTQL
eukprot:4511951-Amphidinium_carterae.1